MDNQFDFFLARADESGSLPNNSIAALYEDSASNLWIGSAEGLSRLSTMQLDLKEPLFENYVVDPKVSNAPRLNKIQSISQDPEGKLWIGSKGGVRVFDPVLKSYIPVNKLIAELSREYPDLYVRRN